MTPSIDSGVKAIIWDLDGTLIDSFEIFSDIAKKLAPEFNLPVPSLDNFLVNYHGSLHDSLSGVFGGIEDKKLDSMVNRFLSSQTAYYENIDEHILQDAGELAKKLSALGLKQAIITNREHNGRGNASPRHIVEHSSLKDHIDHIICGDEADGARKPDPAVANKLLSKWKIEISELLVIGDQFVDAQLAANLGAKAIIVNRFNISTVDFTKKFGDDWQKYIAVVPDLSDVKIDTK